MGINLLGKPKKMAAETWLNTVAEVITDVYDCSEDPIKRALYKGASSDGDITYKKFISTLQSLDTGNSKGDNEDWGSVIADIISPVVLKKNNWVEFFDDTNGKTLDSLNTRNIRSALKNSYDRYFDKFVLGLWAKVNIPELYHADKEGGLF